MQSTALWSRPSPTVNSSQRTEPSTKWLPFERPDAVIDVTQEVVALGR